jgi:ATP-dependent Clp protease adapter protein ClpS
MKKKETLSNQDVHGGSQASPAPVHRGKPAKQTYDISDMQPWREFAVILHNDEEHDMVEVDIQVMKALSCSYPLAHKHTLRAHNNGKTTLAITSREKALEIAGVLKQIKLTVTLRQIN